MKSSRWLFAETQTVAMRQVSRADFDVIRLHGFTLTMTRYFKRETITVERDDNENNFEQNNLMKLFHALRLLLKAQAIIRSAEQ